MAALEQGDAELLLELLDLAADRGLREMQLFPGAGEGEQPCGRLEAAQQIERGQSLQPGRVGFRIPFNP